MGVPIGDLDSLINQLTRWSQYKLSKSLTLLVLGYKYVYRMFADH